MRDFFKSWKRKAGCVALVLACGLLAGSMRTQFVVDEFRFGDWQDSASFLVNCGNSITWMRTHKQKQVSLAPKWTQGPSRFHKPDYVEWLLSGEWEADWKWCWLGFESGSLTRIRFGMTLTYWRVSYWSVILPLTLLSAYLLFSKPRSPKHSQRPERDHA